MAFMLFAVFVFALIGSFKSVTTHAYAVSPSSIKSGVNGNCLDVAQDNDKSGAVVDNYSCNGSDAQDWSVDTVSIKHDGLCLNVASDSQKAGAKVNLSSCDADSPGQVWLADHGGIYNPNAKLCLIDPNSVTSAQLELGTCSNAADEQWSSSMLTLDCSNVSGEGAKVACYAESDWETWQSGSISHTALLNTYTDNAPYEEWCADFVSYVYKQAGYPFTGAYAGWDENNANNVVNYGFTQNASNYVPSPGDVGFFSYTGGHVEIVIAGGAHPTFIYGNSATIDPTTGNGQMEANTILQDGNRGSLLYYLSPSSSS
jgi:hypothetical protein